MELSSQKYSFMVILVGDSGVGKTNIVLRYTKDNIPSNIEPSESFKLFFKSQKINGKKIRLQIWDLAGQQGWEEEAIPRICSKSQGGFIMLNTDDYVAQKAYDFELRPIISKYDIIGNEIIVYFANYNPIKFLYSEEKIEEINKYIEETNSVIDTNKTRKL